MKKLIDKINTKLSNALNGKIFFLLIVLISKYLVGEVVLSMYLILYKYNSRYFFVWNILIKCYIKWFYVKLISCENNNVLCTCHIIKSGS